MSESGFVWPPAWSLLSLAVAVLTVWLLAREIARQRWSALLDEPGARSSHDQPTPRGGGLGIIIVGLAVLAAFLVGDGWPATGWLMFAGFALIAGIGVLDDLHSQPAWLRLILHLLGASLLLWALRPLIEAGGEFSPIPVMLSILAIAWSVNLHNFMDGIDTLLAGQTVWYGLVYALLFLLGNDPVMAVFAAVLAASALGFLPWNWPRARVFMGDGAAGYIGAVVAWLAVYGAVRGIIGWPESLVIASTFLIDSIATVALRALRGRAVWRAHREHLYQRLVQAGHGHGRISACYMLWNLFVAVPAVFLMRMQTSTDRQWMIALTVLALGLLLWLSLRALLAQRRRVTEASP